MASSAKSLEGQVAVITGAGRGIGKGMAIAFAREGLKVVCSSRTSTDIDDVVSTIRASGGEAIAARSDVRSESDMNALMATAVETYGELNNVVLNAAIVSDYTIEAQPTEGWHDVINTNLNGVFYGIRAAVPHLRAVGGGKIIVLGAKSGEFPLPRRAAYGASKAGVIALVKAASADLRSANIALNEIHPGTTTSSIWDTADMEERKDGGTVGRIKQDDEWKKEPEDVADFALHMLKFPNDGPSGQIFSLHGRAMPKNS